MKAMKTKLLLNICLSIISLIITSLLTYYVYTSFKKPPTNILFSDANDEYMFSLYNRRGEKISNIEGRLKLVIDPFTIYQNYPNQVSRKYSINSYGFRDTYHTDKPDTAIVLGGSAAFGFALDSNDQTFASKIAQINGKYRVMNAGVVGFLSGQELALMVHYLDDYRPSLYIVFNGWNDVYDPFIFASNELREKQLVHEGPIGYNNAFFGIEHRLTEYFKLTSQTKNLEHGRTINYHKSMDEKELFQRVFDKYISNIDKMYSFASARGAQMLLVFQPELGSKEIRSSSESEVLRTWVEKYGYLDNKITKRYKELIDKSKKYIHDKHIICIDMNTQYEFTKNGQELFFDVIHPNELGHEVIARIINRMLLDKF